MQYDLSVIKKGMYLCYLPKKTFDPIGTFLSLFQFDRKRIKGVFVHIAKVSDVQGQKVMKIEHHIDTNIVEREVDPADWDRIVVLDYPFREEEVITLLCMARKMIGTEDAIYDTASLPSMWARSTVAKIWRWRRFRKDKPIFNDQKRTVCSSLWSTLAYESLRIEMFDGVHWSSVQPEDYAGNRRMTEIKLKELKV